MELCRTHFGFWQVMDYEDQICNGLTWGLSLSVQYAKMPHCKAEVLMNLLSYVGNLVELVIPRPGPTGDEVPGIGKVHHLHFHLPFLFHEHECCKDATQLCNMRIRGNSAALDFFSWIVWYSFKQRTFPFSSKNVFNHLWVSTSYVWSELSFINETHGRRVCHVNA
jgi:hypothetical protein